MKRLSPLAVPFAVITAVVLGIGCSKQSEAAAKPAEAPPPSPPSPGASPLGVFDKDKLATFRKENSFDPEDEQNLRDAPDAFLRGMGLEGRRDFRLVGARRLFKGSAGRQEVGFIAATRGDWKAHAITVHAVGPTQGSPDAYAGLMAPLNLIDLEPVRDVYVKALAAMPKGGFTGEAAGYRVQSEQKGEGAQLLSLITVAPVSSPPQLDPVVLEPLAPPPPKISKEKKYEFDVWAKSFRDIRSQGRCKQAFIPGQLIAKIGPSTYEWKYFGRCPGECTHFILKTVKTEFEQGGRFQLCVKRDYEVVEVDTNDGFKKVVAVFTEDPK